MRKIQRALLTCLGSIAGMATGQALAADQLATTLKPVRSGAAEVSAIEVTSKFTAAAGRPLALTAAINYPGAWKVAERIRNLKVIDADGEVPLSLNDDPAAQGGFPYYRHWTAQRAVKYPVTVSYSALVQPQGGPNGPPFGIRPAGGGVSGSGSGFLVLPEQLKDADLTVRWDLSDLAAQSRGFASFGEGEVAFKGGAEALNYAWYMAGPVGRYPAQGDVDGFSGVWLGQAPFDPAKELQWTAGFYSYLAKTFKYLGPNPSYRVFMRFLDTPPVGGGTALPRSFMLSRASGPFDPTAEGPRGTFAHEMIHQWVGSVAAADGISSWFAEGLTTYYTTLLQMRGGYSTVAQYGEAVNGSLAALYGSPAANWSASKIADAGFASEKARHVPYMRGQLYFADLDARIRARSGGKRKLDDALAPMFVSREKGATFDHAAWKAIVTKELGPSAAVEFEERILEGKPWTPVVGAYGPCFKRVTKIYVADGKPQRGFAYAPLKGAPVASCKRW